MKIRAQRIKIFRSKKLLLIPISLVVMGGLISIDLYAHQPQKTEMKTGMVREVAKDGRLRSSKHSSPHLSLSKLRADKQEEVVFESKEIAVSGRPNSAVLNWKQDGDNGLDIYVRTKNGFSWSPWAKLDSGTSDKDGTATSGAASGIVIANSIDSIEFKTILKGTDTSPSAEIDLSKSFVATIDSKTGPNGRKSITENVLEGLGLVKSASAYYGGPRIVSRSEWGCPQANWSEWPPEYDSLKHAIIHHTATTEPSDSYATVRAIWQWHAVNNQWGDIGYNYLVDRNGTIFEGRYSDTNYALKNRVDVIGAHALSWNRGAVGISMIGTYQSIKPTGPMLDAVSHMIGYKLAPYGVDPRGISGFGYGDAVIGHRQVNQTQCPGDAAMALRGDIRSWAGNYYDHYRAKYLLHLYDYSHAGTRMFKDGTPIPYGSILKKGDDISVEVLLKNEGAETWVNYGANPVYLATDAPQNRNSQFYKSGSWVAPNRPGTFSSLLDPNTGHITPTNTIQPGQIGVFKFSISVPEVSGVDTTPYQLFNEYVRPVREGVSWFPRDIGMYIEYKVEKKYYDWEIVDKSTYKDSSLTTKAPSLLMPDTRYYSVVKVKNTGNTTWSKNLINLGTFGPTDRSSSLYDSSWLSPSRPATLSEDAVAPGDTGTFAYWIHTPATTSDASYNERFTPVAEGVTWLTDKGLVLNYSVQKTTRDYVITKQGVYADNSLTTLAPATLSPDTTYTLFLELKNTGNTSWYSSNFNLGTSSPYNRSSDFYSSNWLSPNRAARLSETVVAPAQIGTFKTTIRTPRPGQTASYREYFNPVMDGVAWMPDYGLYWQLQVGASAYKYQITSQGVYTDANLTNSVSAPLSVNTDYYLNVKMKNTGTTPWYKQVMNLGTSSQYNRSSPFYNSSWMKDNRPATLDQDVVKPGEVGSFTFRIHTPATKPGSGETREYFNPLIEMVQWLPDYGLYWRIF